MRSTKFEWFVMIIKILIIMIFIILIGCDSGNAIDPNIKVFKNFMPLKIGNYWVYQTIEIDQSGKLLNFTKRLDSFVISSQKQMSIKSDGKIADYSVYKLDLFSDGLFVNSRYYNNRAGILSVVYDKDNFIINDLSPTFAYLINQNELKWNAFKYSNENYQFEFEKVTYKSLYDVTINSQVIYSDDMTVPAGTFNFNQYEELIDTRLLFDYQDYINAVRYYKIENIYRFSEGYGLIYWLQKPTYERYIPINSSPNFPSKITYINGVQRELVRFKVELK